jgi:hypothetical protein
MLKVLEFYITCKFQVLYQEDILFFSILELFFPFKIMLIILYEEF